MKTSWLTVTFVAGCALALGTACQIEADNIFPPAGAGGSSSSSSSGDGEGGAAAGTGEGGLGMGGGLGSGGAEDGCAKVDFLFIIDNSVSMGDQQAALIASFPGFMSAIDDALDADDYHIMVADTDDDTRCTAANCASGAMSADTLCIPPQNGYACNTAFDGCDKTIGSGVVHPAGKGATNAPCTIHGGNRYIVEGEPNLVDTFSCMALVGLAGHPSERPMDSLVSAMSAGMNDGGCNDGFLRDDAILVVTFISDDPNYEDSGAPQEWYDAVVAAKNNNPDAVVMLGITPNFDGCKKANKVSGSHWSEFVALWGDRGLEGSVCEDDYAPFFAQAISVIDDTCDEFEPPS